MEEIAFLPLKPIRGLFAHLAELEVQKYLPSYKVIGMLYSVDGCYNLAIWL